MVKRTLDIPLYGDRVDVYYDNTDTDAVRRSPYLMYVNHDDDSSHVTMVAMTADQAIQLATHLVSVVIASGPEAANWPVSKYKRLVNLIYGKQENS